MKRQDAKILNTVLVGALAAMVYVVTLFRFPLLGSKVHFANAVCLLGGMLLGPTLGGLAAGLGSALYDAFNGYDLVNVLITFVSKFAMAWVCGIVMEAAGKRKSKFDRTVLAGVAGALTYVALYMLKTFIYQRFVYGYPPDAVGVTMMSKLIPSLINAGAAVVAAPLFFHAVLPALRAAGIVHSEA
ncbi:MAG: ECF transporter S component [Clostridia bacterium]|nr:ECF transporter S component [Clostridia bacterium]